MKRLLAVAAICLLSGCASFGGREVAVGCKVADTASTLHIIGGGGKEFNPIMAKLLAAGPIYFIAAQIAVGWLIWSYYDDLPEIGKMAAMAGTCFPPAHNIGGLL